MISLAKDDATKPAFDMASCLAVISTSCRKLTFCMMLLRNGHQPVILQNFNKDNVHCCTALLASAINNRGRLMNDLVQHQGIAKVVDSHERLFLTQTQQAVTNFRK
jgi:hypothetical protein